MSEWQPSSGCSRFTAVGTRRSRNGRWRLGTPTHPGSGLEADGPLPQQPSNPSAQPWSGAFNQVRSDPLLPTRAPRSPSAGALIWDEAWDVVPGQSRASPSQVIGRIPPCRRTVGRSDERQVGGWHEHGVAIKVRNEVGFGTSLWDLCGFEPLPLGVRGTSTHINGAGVSRHRHKNVAVWVAPPFAERKWHLGRPLQLRGSDRLARPAVASKPVGFATRSRSGFSSLVTSVELPHWRSRVPSSVGRRAQDRPRLKTGQMAVLPQYSRSTISPVLDRTASRPPMTTLGAGLRHHSLLHWHASPPLPPGTRGHAGAS